MHRLFVEIFARGLPGQLRTRSALALPSAKLGTHRIGYLPAQLEARQHKHRGAQNAMKTERSAIASETEWLVTPQKPQK